MGGADRQDLNAFTSLRSERSLEEAHHVDERRTRGFVLPPLHGIPICLKDNINTLDGPTTAATPALRHHCALQNAPIAQALIDAGAIVMAKNNMQELGFGVTCNNPAFGSIMNPSSPSRIPGGSSGGTAVAVAARACPAGIGTDTGGSIRVPAALCGVAGFRPTVHRWSQQGDVPISATRDTAGPIARTIEDLTLLDQIVTGREGHPALSSLKGMRLGVTTRVFLGGSRR
jgi:Asp-tRNA(Asn)/Glu-tRNA(Gln) amidotransferase A subunit family amidase